MLTGWDFIKPSPNTNFVIVQTERNPTVDEIVTVINGVAFEYPEIRGVTFGVGSVGVAYAYATGKLIVFSSKYVADPFRLQQSIEYDVKIKFHPPLGHCSGAQFLAYHEAAHVIQSTRGTVYAQDQIRERYGSGESLRGILSRYSFNVTISFNEALAEAFAAVKCNGGNWAEKELYNILVG